MVSMTPNPYEAPRTVGEIRQGILPRYTLELLFLVGAACSAHLVYDLRTVRWTHPLIIPALVFMVPVQLGAALGGFAGSRMSGAAVGVGIALLVFADLFYLSKF